MPQTIEQVLSTATFYTDDEDYILIKLAPNAITVAAGIVAQNGIPFNALIVDKDEVTLLIQSLALEDFVQRLREYEVAVMKYRLITIDVVLEPELIGFMACLTEALAAASIPILAYGAYSRDHLFVPVDKLDSALHTLENLKISRGQG